MVSILYCANSAVFHGILLSASSIADKCSELLDVHIATMDRTEQDENYTAVTSEQADFLRGVLKEINPQSDVRLHDFGELFTSELSSSPNAASSYTPYTLLRLLIDMDKSMPEKILYLDTDTLAMKNIGELYRFDLDGHDFAAAPDHLGRFFINPRYMNAGVILFNLSQIRRSGLLKRARNLCNKRRYPFPDQDVLNRCARHKVFLPRKFNEQKKLHEDTVIRHFSKSIRWTPFFHTVNVKPWDENGLHNIYKTHAYDGEISRWRELMNRYEEVRK